MIIAVYIVLGLVLYGAIGGWCWVALEELYEDERHPSHTQGYVFGGGFWPILFIPLYWAAKRAIARKQRELDKKEQERILRENGL